MLFLYRTYLYAYTRCYEPIGVVVLRSYLYTYNMAVLSLGLVEEVKYTRCTYTLDTYFYIIYIYIIIYARTMTFGPLLRGGDNNNT